MEHNITRNNKFTRTKSETSILQKHYINHLQCQKMISDNNYIRFATRIARVTHVVIANFNIFDDTSVD